MQYSKGEKGLHIGQFWFLILIIQNNALHFLSRDLGFVCFYLQFKHLEICGLLNLMENIVGNDFLLFIIFS